MPGPIFHLQFADFPDSMLYSDYLPELSRHLSCSGPAHPKLGADQVSWEDLLDMDLPSFRPAFLVLCRVLLNVIHECLKLRLEQRPAGEPSLLSIKQASYTSFSVTLLCAKPLMAKCILHSTITFLRSIAWLFFSNNEETSQH